MNVTLIQPTTGRRNGKKFRRPWTLEPLNITALAGLTPNEVSLTFYDDRIEEIDYEADTDLVGISVETSTALRSYEIARQFKARDRTVVMGGVHPTLMPEEVANYADSIVVGQAEESWPRLISDFKSKNLKKFYSQEKPNLSKVVNDRSILKGKKYLPARLIEYGRGCPFNCEFCDIPVYFNGRYDVRPLDRLVTEIEESSKKFFVIIDDNLGSDPKILKKFCEKITPLGVKWVSQTSITLARDEKLLDAVAESGCKGFLIGFESINPDNIKQMNKGFNNSISYQEAISRFNQREIKIHGSFIIGYDHDTLESIDRLVDFAIESKLFIANFNPLTPIPKTRLYERLKKEGRLNNERWWLDYNFRYGDFVFTPANMSAETLAEKCEEAKDRFYGLSSIFSRGVKSRTNCGSLSDFASYVIFNFLTRREVNIKREAYLGLEGTFNNQLNQSQEARYSLPVFK